MPKPRTYTTGAVVGHGRAIAPRKGAATRAINEGDPERIASASARLIGSSETSGRIFYHALRFLVEEARKIIAQGNGASREDIEKKIRDSWLAFKSQELPDMGGDADEQVIDQIVLGATWRALAELQK